MGGKAQEIPPWDWKTGSWQMEKGQEDPEALEVETEGQEGKGRPSVPPPPPTLPSLICEIVFTSSDTGADKCGKLKPEIDQTVPFESPKRRWTWCG